MNIFKIVVSSIILCLLFSSPILAQLEKPPEGQSKIVILCEKAYGGYKIMINCDGSLIGKFKKKNFSYTNVQPGSHVLSAELTGINLASPANINLNCEPNKVYYVIARASGITIYDVSVSFSQIDENVAQNLVTKYKKI